MNQVKRKKDYFPFSHFTLVGRVAVQAMEFVIPDEIVAQARSTADLSANSSVAPSAVRQFCRPSKSMQTSTRYWPYDIEL